MLNDVYFGNTDLCHHLWQINPQRLPPSLLSLPSSLPSFPSFQASEVHSAAINVNGPKRQSAVQNPDNAVVVAERRRLDPSPAPLAIGETESVLRCYQNVNIRCTAGDLLCLTRVHCHMQYIVVGCCFI